MKGLVFGYGLIGRQRAAALLACDAIETIDVYDPRIRPGDVVAPGACAVDRDAAFRGRYDLAIVATPHDVVVGEIASVARVAKNILVEKPLGRTAAEARTIASSAAEAGSRLFVGFNFRFLRNVVELHRILDENAFGRVLSVEAVLAHGAEPGYQNSWKTDLVKCGGGACIDPGVHLFDLLRWLFGDFRLAAGSLNRIYWPIDVEDHAMLIFAIGSGALASVVVSLSSWRSRFEITVELEHAQILLRGRGRFYGPQQLTVVTKWPWLHPDLPRESTTDFGSEDVSLADETRQFVNAAGNVAAGKALATALDGIRAAELVDDCYRLATDATLITADRQ